MKTTFIYALKDPNTSEIRYIGKADDPVKRFGEHQGHASRNKKSHLYNWFRSCGGIPILEILAEIPKDFWQWFERTAIFEAREGGFRLTNLTSGGDGLVNPSLEVLEKIRASSLGRRHSLETRSKMSAIQKIVQVGRKASPETKAKMSQMRKGRRGTPCSLATREKIRQARLGKSSWNKGKPHSAETCEKIRQKAIGRIAWNKGRQHSAETRLKISLALRRKHEGLLCS